MTNVNIPLFSKSFNNDKEPTKIKQWLTHIVTVGDIYHHTYLSNRLLNLPMEHIFLNAELMFTIDVNCSNYVYMSRTEFENLCGIDRKEDKLYPFIFCHVYGEDHNVESMFDASLLSFCSSKNIIIIFHYDNENNINLVIQRYHGNRLYIMENDTLMYRIPRTSHAMACKRSECYF